MYGKYIKRILDIILSALALLVLSPIFIILAILVRVKLGSPVIFKQQRPGKNEKIFTMYKFRSMTDERDESGALLPDAKRLNQFGKTLRATSLDELPEIINILKGDMSVIGPRPLLTSYLPLYNAHQARRHQVRPGLTGLAQVNGRNQLSWEQKFDLDVEYVDHITLFGDFHIFFKTIGKVIKREGISSSNLTTMPPFQGSEQREDAYV